MTCFNGLVKKDEAIKASSSSDGVERAFTGLTQSLAESRQKYEKDKEVWEAQLKSVELEKNQAMNKFVNSEESNKVLEAKLKLAEEEVAGLKDVEQQKNNMGEKLKKAEELLKEKVSSEKAKKKVAVKKSFSAGWDKGSEKGLAAMNSQMEYASVKFFRDGWVEALKKLKVAGNSELFLEHTHGPPPSPGEEEEDEAVFDESSMMTGDQFPVAQSSEQLPAAGILAEQLLSSEQPTSSQPTKDIVGGKEKL